MTDQNAAIPATGTPAAGSPPAGAGATAPAAGQPAGREAASPSNAPATPPGGAWTPDGLPDHLKGRSEREIVEGLIKENKGYRDAGAKYVPPPADPAGYDWKFSDKVAPYTTDLKDDKLFGEIGKIALKNGLNAPQAAGFVNDVFETFLDLNLLDKPVDTAAELAKLTPANARGLPPADQDAARQARVSTNLAYVDGLVRDGFNAEAAAAIKAELAGFPELHELVEHVRNGMGIKPALSGNAAPATTEADLRARQSDPRNIFGNIKYDAAFAAETTRLYRGFYGDGERR
jgi:hypothetical protein